MPQRPSQATQTQVSLSSGHKLSHLYVQVTELCANMAGLLRGYPMNVRIILWTLAMAYGGFLWAGRGIQSFNSITVSGALIGAVTGFLLAIMFSRRAKRKHL